MYRSREEAHSFNPLNKTDCITVEGQVFKREPKSSKPQNSGVVGGGSLEAFISRYERFRSTTEPSLDALVRLLMNSGNLSFALLGQVGMNFPWDEYASDEESSPGERVKTAMRRYIADRHLIPQTIWDYAAQYNPTIEVYQKAIEETVAQSWAESYVRLSLYYFLQGFIVGSLTASSDSRFWLPKTISASVLIPLTSQLFAKAFNRTCNPLRRLRFDLHQAFSLVMMQGRIDIQDADRATLVNSLIDGSIAKYEETFAELGFKCYRAGLFGSFAALESMALPPWQVLPSVLLAAFSQNLFREYAIPISQLLGKSFAKAQEKLLEHQEKQARISMARRDVELTQEEKALIETVHNETSKAIGVPEMINAMSYIVPTMISYLLRSISPGVDPAQIMALSTGSLIPEIQLLSERPTYEEQRRRHHEAVQKLLTAFKTQLDNPRAPLIPMHIESGISEPATQSMNDSPTYRLELQQFSIPKSNGTLAEDPVKFDGAVVETGQALIVAGAHSVGKTTLLRALSGDERWNTTGSPATINGHDLGRVHPEVRRRKLVYISSQETVDVKSFIVYFFTHYQSSFQLPPFMSKKSDREKFLAKWLLGEANPSSKRQFEQMILDYLGNNLPSFWTQDRLQEMFDKGGLSGAQGVVLRIMMYFAADESLGLLLDEPNAMMNNILWEEIVYYFEQRLSSDTNKVLLMMALNKQIDLLVDKDWVAGLIRLRTESELTPENRLPIRMTSLSEEKGAF